MSDFFIEPDQRPTAAMLNFRHIRSGFAFTIGKPIEQTKAFRLLDPTKVEMPNKHAGANTLALDLQVGVKLTQADQSRAVG